MLITLFWGKVALFCIVCEHDLIMDLLLENSFTDISIIMPNRSLVSGYDDDIIPHNTQSSQHSRATCICTLVCSVPCAFGAVLCVFWFRPRGSLCFDVFLVHPPH